MDHVIADYLTRTKVMLHTKPTLSIPPEHRSCAQRLDEIAQILAQGLLRLREYNTSRLANKHR